MNPGSPDPLSPQVVPPVAVPDTVALMQSARERRALDVLALVAVALAAWVVAPVGIGILLGALAGFSLEPLYERLRVRFGRPALAALACVALAAGAFVVILGALGSLLIMRGAVLARQLITSFEPGGPARTAVEGLIVRLGLQSQAEQLSTRLQDAAAEVAARLGTYAALIAGRTFDGVLILFFLMMTIYFVLRHWRLLEQRAIDSLPLNPRHSRELFDEFRNVGRTTLLGTIVTGVAQGVLAWIGYLLFGVPEPAFFGAATVLASLLPAVGTLLVWVPLGIWLLVTGQAASGIGELIYGALVVVGLSDYLIRPRLVGGHGNLPALFMFAALFGGIEAFGLIGLILGPLCIALAVALIRIYVRDELERGRASGRLPIS